MSVKPSLGRLWNSQINEGETDSLKLEIDDNGRIMSLVMKRWGNPEGGDFHYTDFGGFVEEESTFNGYTIPSRIRAGWYFGSDRFEGEGEFFRVTIDEAVF